MDIQRVFASNVRAYRKSARLSQEKLAEIAGLHRTYIGGIEQRRVNVSLKNIGKIADALGVDPALLFLETSDSDADEKDALTDAAVVVWSDDEVAFRPIKPMNRDLTVHVLADLISRGYRGSDLAGKYREVSEEVARFLDEPQPAP